MKKLPIFLVCLLVLATWLPFHGKAVEESTEDVALWDVLKPLDTTITFLNTGAHPDDERSDFLAYLSKGLGIKTSSLIANRGEGGQNAIGNELGNLLGIIRSNEMIEAAKVNGVKAYHLSDVTSDAIYDFGFSKSPDETLTKWGEDVTYERFIRFIRTYQPDIVMPSFRNVDSQHGHHRLITILSEKAFADAANPTIFPEQLKEGLSTWQIKKLYLPAESQAKATTSIEIGDYDPIYGMSYPQIGEASRYLHKSQGMGQDIPVAPRQFHLELLKSSTPTTDPSLFAGIPYDFEEWAKTVPSSSLSTQLTQLQKKLESMIELYPKREDIFKVGQKTLRDVEKLIDMTQKAKLDATIKNDLLHKLAVKQEQLQQVNVVASNISITTSISSFVLTQGENAEVTLTISNQGKQKLQHLTATLLTPGDWKVTGNSNLQHIKPGESKQVVFQVRVPQDEPYFQPYAEPVLQAQVEFKEDGVTTRTVVDLDNTVSVLPELSVTPTPINITVNTANIQESIPVTVKVKNYDEKPQNASISLDLPEGWKSEPSTENIELSKRFEEKEVSFTLLTPPTVQDGTFDIKALATANGKTYNTTVQEIKYSHINDSYYLSPSNIKGVAFELLKPENLQVGYIESGFDTMADSLLNAGFNITKLTPQELATADLTQFDTIVTGIRVTLGRKDFLENNPRLLDYVNQGGHLVVQYLTSSDPWNPNVTPPYPLQIGNPSIRWRVTDENAKVTLTQPNHPLFHYPNEIAEADWENWVQERGLYFPMKWDSKYETFLSMADPNEAPFTSGILMAKYGKGTYLYTNLVFYRQIGAQVPGGYRIFSNLISYGAIN